MELYTQASISPNILWPEPMETVWQLLGTGPGVPGSRVPHLTIADQLFIAAVANIPRPSDPGVRSPGWRTCFRPRAQQSMPWARELPLG